MSCSGASAAWAFSMESNLKGLVCQTLFTSVQVVGLPCIINATSSSWKQPFLIISHLEPRVSSAGAITTSVNGSSPAHSFKATAAPKQDGPCHMMACIHVPKPSKASYSQRIPITDRLPPCFHSARKEVSYPPLLLSAEKPLSVDIFVKRSHAWYSFASVFRMVKDKNQPFPQFFFLCFNFFK